jgi:osmotically-inducible protein OsmY
MAYREDYDRGRYARGSWNEPNWRNEPNYGRGESFSRGGGWNEPNYGYGGGYGGAGGGYGGYGGSQGGGYGGGTGGYGGYGRGNEWYSTSGRGPESYYGSNRGFEGYGQGGYGQGGYGQGGYGRGNEWNYGMGRGGEQPYYGYGRGEERMGFAGEFRNPSWSRESQYGGYQGYQGNQGLGNYPGYGGYSWSEYGGYGGYGGGGETRRFTTRDRGYGSEIGRGELGRGSHYGRGPRNYRRSDDRIEEDINEQLTRHPEVDATEIEVNVDNGEVTLTGTVDNRNAKRIAEDVAESVSGVRDVHNQIRVSIGATGAGGAAGEREVARPTEREGRGRESQRAGSRGTTRSGATAGG